MKFKFGDEVIVKSGFFKGVEGAVTYIYGQFEDISYSVDGYKYINGNLLNVSMEIKEDNLKLLNEDNKQCNGNCNSCKIKKEK